ncbi:Biotin--protein ligase [Holothuria leucospilota]|uniref:Biotin--protein ligase n=1 Tax=Holothuria leucospilota TaxID=206669 RepID=A0A9Q1BHF3_HOLLE|nr:Biotin--protein ligase [Holothuria leucospilota]
MLTVCYTYLTLAHFWRHHRKEQAVMKALQMHGVLQSVAFRKILHGDEEGWNRKTTRASELCEAHDERTKFSHFSKYIEPTLGKQMVIVKPKQSVDLSKEWTSFIGSSVASPDSSRGNRSRDEDSTLFFLLEASPPAKDSEGKLKLRDVSRDRVVNLSDLAVPVAWKPGEPFGILVQATPENFSKVGTAFMEGVLELDDGLYVDQILSVDVQGHPFNLVDPLLDKDVGFTLPGGNSTDNDNGGGNLEGAGEGALKPGRPSRKKHSSEFTKKVVKQKTGTDEKGDVKGDASDLSLKPPNILIYSGDSPNATQIFESALKALEGVLDRDKYVVYQLKQNELLTHPWAENTALLVTVGLHQKTLSKEEFEIINDFVVVGGKLLNVGMYLALEVGQYAGAQNSSLISANIRYKAKNSADEVAFKADYLNDQISVTSEDSSCVLVSEKDNKLVVECAEDRGKVIHSKLPLVALEHASDENAKSCLQQILADVLSRLQISCQPEWRLPSLTPCYLVGSTLATSRVFHDSIKSHLKKDTLQASPVSLYFTSNIAEAQKKVSADLLTVVSDTAPSPSSFDVDIYKKNLKSRVLGNLLMYVEVVPTTMTLFESFMLKVPKSVGAIAVASRQTKGKGRGGNKWLSPLGCAMFTAHVQLRVGTKLASKLSFLQHMAALAAVESICSRPGYEDLELRVKWPNDIYYSNKQKIGGVLVTSSCMDRDIHALIGVGFNVANSKPTLCVNDLISDLNEKKQTDLKPLRVEEVIAWTMNVLEKMIEDFQRDGHLSFCDRYYKKWLHSDMKVHLEKEDGPQVTVIGLDGSGYLEVKDEKGKLISLQPDGNSFDMLKNLIQMKTR